MAFEVLSHLNATPFVQTAFEEGGIPEHSFAFKLAPDASELYLGGDNKDLYKGELEHHQGQSWLASLDCTLMLGLQSLNPDTVHPVLPRHTTTPTDALLGWQGTLNASTFLHNGTPMFTDLATILDTGTSVIAGPPEAVYDFFSAFPGDVGVIPSLGQTLYASASHSCFSFCPSGS